MLLVHFFKIFESTVIVNAGMLYFSQAENLEGWGKAPKLIYSYLHCLNILIHECKIKIFLKTRFVWFYHHFMYFYSFLVKIFFGKNSSNKLELDYVFGKYLQVIFKFWILLGYIFVILGIILAFLRNLFFYNCDSLQAKLNS